MANPAIGAIAIIALLIGAAAFIFAARPDVVSQPEVSTGCPTGQAAQNETVAGAFQCITVGSTVPNLSKDFFQSGGGTSVSVTTSFADVLPQQTWTPMNLNGYTNFKIFSVVSFSSSVAFSIVQGKACVHNNSGLNTQTCTFTSSVTSGHLLVVDVDTNSATVTSVVDSQGSYSCDECNILDTFYGSLYYFVATSSGSDTVTVTYPSAVTLQQIDIIEYAGVTTPQKGHSNGVGSSTSMSVTSFTPSSSAIVIAMAVVGGGANTCTAGTGYTIGFSNSGSVANLCDEYSNSAVNTAQTAPMTQVTNGAFAEIAEAFPPITNTLNFKIQYSTNGGSTWTDVSASTLSQSSTITTAFIQSSYFAIAAGAKADNLFRAEVDASSAVTITLYKFGIETQP